jgi:hypothetical protein
VVLALSLTVLTMCPAPKPRRFLSSQDAKLPLHSYALVSTAVALNLLYNLRDGAPGGAKADRSAPYLHYEDLVSRLHKHRNRLVTDNQGFSADVPMVYSALHSSGSEAAATPPENTAKRKRSLHMFFLLANSTISLAFVLDDESKM